MKAFKILNLIAFILLIVGGLAWLVIGLMDYNIIQALFFNNNVAMRVVYSLVGISSLWLLFSAAYSGQILFPWQADRTNR